MIRMEAMGAALHKVRNEIGRMWIGGGLSWRELEPTSVGLLADWAKSVESVLEDVRPCPRRPHAIDTCLMTHSLAQLRAPRRGLTAVAGLAGAIGLVTGSIDLGAVINRRLPFGSPVFGGLALIVVVVLPMATGVVLSWRGSDGANLVAIADGALLMGWIVVELAVIRSFSILQPIFGVVGAAIAFGGYRRWHLTWGATEDEVVGVMPGDDISVPGEVLGDPCHHH
jgi:hypothetical protein